MDSRQVIQFGRALYEANKNVDRYTYETRKKEAIDNYNHSMRNRSEWNEVNDSANQLEWYIKNDKDLTGYECYQLEQKVNSLREKSNNLYATAGDYISAKMIADWYEDHSFEWIQAKKKDEEFAERRTQQRIDEINETNIAAAWFGGTEKRNEPQNIEKRTSQRKPDDFFSKIHEMFKPENCGMDYSSSPRPEEKKAVISVADHFKRAEAYRNEGDYDSAIDEYSEIIRLDPNNADVYFGRGAVCSGWGDYDQAISDCDYVIRLYPDNAMAHFFRGTAYVNKGANYKALADANQAIRLDPDNAEMYFFRSGVYLNMGNYDRAISDCDKAIELDCCHLGSYIGRGVIYYDKKGDPRRAAVDFEAALRIDPNNALAKQWFEKARRGR